MLWLYDKRLLLFRVRNTKKSQGEMQGQTSNLLWWFADRCMLENSNTKEDLKEMQGKKRERLQHLLQDG